MPNSGGTFNARRPTVVTRCHRCGRRRSSPTSCSPIAPVAPVTTARSDAALAIAAVDPAPAPPAPALATLVSAVDCAGASLPSCDDIARLQALQLGACAMRSSCNGKCAEIYMGKYKSLSFVSKMHISPSRATSSPHNRRLRLGSRRRSLLHRPSNRMRPRTRLQHMIQHLQRKPQCHRSSHRWSRRRQSTLRIGRYSRRRGFHRSRHSWHNNRSRSLPQCCTWSQPCWSRRPRSLPGKTPHRPAPP